MKESDISKGRLFYHATKYFAKQRYNTPYACNVI